MLSLSGSCVSPMRPTLDPSRSQLIRKYFYKKSIYLTDSRRVSMMLRDHPLTRRNHYVFTFFTVEAISNTDFTALDAILSGLLPYICILEIVLSIRSQIKDMAALDVWLLLVCQNWTLIIAVIWCSKRLPTLQQHPSGRSSTSVQPTFLNHSLRQSKHGWSYDQGSPCEIDSWELRSDYLYRGGSVVVLVH